ncbi:hypothetical protein C5Y96_13705 [Blastopirellula marina]|uniref:Carboxypeptidase regulatory-like domain-containing protein n=1 Tax=Blastopirellula marina TaxID=124 RepID=A0A2S8FH25_9BACT|nr:MULTISPECIES: hypothetical protein [Pirellulaceae]PQO31390.1 hypothetical protein C5Y96_13705 [Blastopirellula marina]RCS51784.1 hypothetical protein DTL36_13715 [Bremerella cremea]
MIRLDVLTVAALFLLGICGCDSKSGELAPVSATVTSKGSPVTEGTLTFTPEAGGKPGSGKINSDGTVTWTTYKEGDGLTKGAGRLSFAPPPVPIPENLKPGESLPTHALAGMSPKETTITVNEGSNTLAIELVK